MGHLPVLDLLVAAREVLQPDPLLVVGVAQHHARLDQVVQHVRGHVEFKVLWVEIFVKLNLDGLINLFVFVSNISDP